MKAVFVVFNQAHTERVEFMLDRMNIKGFTWWSDVKGRGSDKGEPRMGTHTWPEINAALLTIIPEEIVDELLENVKKLDKINEEIGVRAFAWDIVKSV
jgi:nitrogen regulatory protein PII